MKSCTCLQKRTPFTASDKEMYPASEASHAVTTFILESQLTDLFASITTAPDAERLLSRQARKARVRGRLLFGYIAYTEQRENHGIINLDEVCYSAIEFG